MTTEASAGARGDSPMPPEGGDVAFRVVVGMGGVFVVVLVLVLVTGLYDAVTTSDEERATDEAADRVVRVIDRHDGQVREAGAIVGSGKDTALAGSLKAELAGEDVRLTASSLAATAITLEHKGVTKTIHLGPSPMSLFSEETVPHASSDWGNHDFFPLFESEGGSERNEARGDAKRVAAVVTEYSQRHDRTIGEKDLIDTRTEDDELTDALDEEFGGDPPEIEWSDHEFAGRLDVSSSGDTYYVHLNRRVGGGQVVISEDPDEVVLLTVEE